MREGKLGKGGQKAVDMVTDIVDIQVVVVSHMLAVGGCRHDRLVLGEDTGGSGK